MHAPTSAQKNGGSRPREAAQDKGKAPADAAPDAPADAPVQAHEHSTAAEQERQQSLNMNNILFYIVYSQHDGFVWLLIHKMLVNVQEYYAAFPDVVDNLRRLDAAVQGGKLAYRACVVVFFFLLTIDTRMRHWILDSEQSPEDAAFRREQMQKHVQLVPHAAAYLERKDARCFLGQRATFLPLDPHAAVAVLLPMSDEGFFEGICNGNEPNAFADTYARIQRLVLFA